MIAYAFLTPVALFMLLWALFYRPLSGVANLAKSAAKSVSARVARTALGKRALAHAAWPGVQTYTPIAVVALLGAAAAVGAGKLFTHLAHNVQITTSALNRFDQTVWSIVDATRQPWLTDMFASATFVGGSVGMTTIVVVAAGYLIYTKQRASAAYIIGTAFGGEALNLVLKANFARARPDLTNALAYSRWYSFPSGHAMTSFIVLGAAAYVVLRQKWRWQVKSACIAGATSAAIFIGLSRVYLGVHWASDIAGAWTAATVWLAATTVAFELSLRLRQRQRGETPSSPTADVPDKPLPEAAA